MILLSAVVFFSCKPMTTPEQSAQYDQCRKVIIDNDSAFMSHAYTQGMKDSLMNYIKDLKENNFEQLVKKYDLGEEDVQAFLNSICQNAASIKAE
jgi:hypothetical protein